jgi:hypothetical protein
MLESTKLHRLAIFMFATVRASDIHTAFFTCLFLPLSSRRYYRQRFLAFLWFRSFLSVCV